MSVGLGPTPPAMALCGVWIFFGEQKGRPKPG